MCTVLMSLRQWDVVDGTDQAPTPADENSPTPTETKEIAAWKVRSISAFMEISFRVADSAKTVLGGTRNPKVAWDLLAKRFGAKQEGLQSTLISKLQLAMWNGVGSIHTHRDYMVELRCQLADAGMQLSDQSFLSHFIESLPPSLDLFVALYEDSNHDVDFLCDKFAKYENRLKLRALKTGKADVESSSSVAMFGQKTTEKKEKKKRDMSKVTCYGCDKKGHVISRCPDKKKEKKEDKPEEKGKGKETSEASTSAKAPSGTLYTAMSGDALLANGELTDRFYVDSGASDHLIPSKGDLRAYKEFAKPVEISAANNGKIYAYGTGTLRVAAPANGLEQEQDLEDVYYAPGIHARLVSLGKLEGQGWDIRLREGGMELRNRDGDMFANIERVNNVYPMVLKVVPPKAMLAAWTDEGADPTYEELEQRLDRVALVATAKGGNGTEASLMTWHRRLGHPTFKTVVELARKGASGMVITDLPAEIPGLDACAACVAAKSVHLPHKEGRERANEHLGRVHIDVAGPMEVQSAGGKAYEYVVVDDHTRVVYTRPLRLKSEAVDAFRTFKAAAEGESGKRLREVMTDNAGELSKGEMRKICEEEGIRLSTTVPYHPASNGIAERAIGVLTGTVRAMLHDSGLPKFLWAEAFSTATYVHNRTPTKALGGLTPFEVLYGMKPDVRDLRAFGAPCAVVEPSEKLKKLDDRASMCFFVGYKYGGGGYRVWDPKRKVVVESRDITFFEDGLPPPTLHQSATPADDADKPVVQQPPNIGEPTPAVKVPPLIDAPAPSSHTVPPGPSPTSQPQPRLVVRLPGRYMDRQDAQKAPIRDKPEGTDTTRSVSDDDDDESPIQSPIHDVGHIPNYPMRSLRSGLKREGGRGGSGLERGGGGGGSAMLVVDDAGYPPVAFSAGLPGGIQLSQLPDPRNVREALAAQDAEGWREAMNSEMENLKSHDVYELVPRIGSMRTLRLGWVLHRKFKNGVFDKNKARLVARGNHQRPGIDYNESFSPVMRLESLRTLLALAAIRDLDIMQFDITSAYLHGTLKEEIYMQQPDGYVAPGKENWVWRLKKGLYGLVQAGRTWNEELNAHMGNVGFTATAKDPAIYVRGTWSQEDFVAGGFWVDDFIGIGSGKELNALARGIDAKYGITGLGQVKWVLGMLIERDRAAHTISISQEAFINTILTRFNLTEATSLSTPLAPGTQLTKDDCPTSQEEKDDMATRPYRELVGALAWLALGTRPDIAYATSSLARFGHNPGRAHWEAAKRVLRYLKGTRRWRLTLGGKPPQIAGFTDADWGSDRDDRRSIGAYIIKIGSGAVSWKSKKQTCVALSSTEAEYMALCQTAKESVWMVDFLKNLGISVCNSMVINVDNQASIALAKNPVFHDRSKHIHIQYHYTRDLVKEKRISLNYIPTKEMVADLLTKALPRTQHEYLAKGIGLF
jgi:transposase InsO family protein